MARKQKTSVKSKKAVRDTGIAEGDDPNDIWDKTRMACRSGMEKAFAKIIKVAQISEKERVKTPETISKLYEENLYKRFNSNLIQYKQRFRKDLIAMRNPDTQFAENLLTGEMTVEQFCELKEAELISKKQKKQNQELLQKELRNSIAKKPPTKLSEVEVQNTIVRDKWGISESAAKVDPRFENYEGAS